MILVDIARSKRDFLIVPPLAYLSSRSLTTPSSRGQAAGRRVGATGGRPDTILRDKISKDFSTRKIECERSLLQGDFLLLPSFWLFCWHKAVQRGCMHYKDKFKTPAKDWLISRVMLDLSLEAILRKFIVNRDYDIPYLAGYSKNGKIIYIDRHMPKSFVTHGRRVKTDQFLIIHEAIEKTLIDELGLQYQFAHQIALRTEQETVRAHKISWKEYDRFMQAYIKEIGDERLKSVPKNLDFKPYHDEHDDFLLKRMKQVAKK